MGDGQADVQNNGGAHSHVIEGAHVRLVGCCCPRDSGLCDQLLLIWLVDRGLEQIILYRVGANRGRGGLVQILRYRLGVAPHRQKHQRQWHHLAGLALELQQLELVAARCLVAGSRRREARARLLHREGRDWRRNELAGPARHGPPVVRVNDPLAPIGRLGLLRLLLARGGGARVVIGRPYDEMSLVVVVVVVLLSQVLELGWRVLLVLLNGAEAGPAELGWRLEQRSRRGLRHLDLIRVISYHIVRLL